MSISRIVRTYTRTYTDSGQVTTYVEWVSDCGERGRTEGDATNAHMVALLARAEREDIHHMTEVW